MAEIENDVFDFGKRFPHSKKKKLITDVDKAISFVHSKDVLFGDYAAKWWKDMKPGMTSGQIRDYDSIIRVHHITYFQKRSFNHFTPVLIKKTLSHLQSKKNQATSAFC